MSQTRWVGPQAASTGFRQSQAVNINQQPFSTIQTKNRASNENIVFLSMDAGNNITQVCHSCSVNMKSLSYGQLFSGNSIIYSQNVPVVM